MRIDEAFPSKYLKAEDDFEGDEDLIVTIDDVQMENIGQGKDAEDKPVVYFTDHEKGLVLNKTNATTLKGLFGNDTDQWRRKRIALFATEVEYAGRQMLGIRVRMRAPSSSRSRQPVAAGPAPADEPDHNDPFDESNE